MRKPFVLTAVFGLLCFVSTAWAGPLTAPVAEACPASIQDAAALPSLTPEPVFSSLWTCGCLTTDPCWLKHPGDACGEGGTCSGLVDGGVVLTCPANPSLLRCACLIES
jgi:hypothetical protein